MDRKIQKSLFDILHCIDEIDSYFNSVPRRFDYYRDNALLRSAIHMNISIIGEATNRILKTDSESSISNAQQIVGSRTSRMHGDVGWCLDGNDLGHCHQRLTQT